MACARASEDEQKQHFQHAPSFDMIHRMTSRMRDTISVQRKETESKTMVIRLEKNKDEKLKATVNERIRSRQ
jgi:hypothetical protein